MTKSAHGRKYATGHLDQDDRLVQVSKGVYASGAVLENEFTVNYSYDSMGRMLRRDNGSEVTTFVWDGWDLLSEETDSVVTTYLVPDGLVWSFSRGEDVFQVHTDALGSVRVVTDSEGDVVARFEYGAWGELLPGSFDNVGLALRFVGGLGVRTDLETGLYSMRHRWYDAELQRFISRDPIGLSGGSNLYAYAGNDPTLKIDPTGQRVIVVYYWEEYSSWVMKSFECDSEAIKFIRRTKRIRRIIFLGHGTPTQQTTTLKDYQYPWQLTGVDGLVIGSDGQTIQWKIDGKRHNLRDLNLQSKGVEEIELRGCNTAGGCTSPVERAKDEKSLRQSNRIIDDQSLPGPTEDNIANALAKDLRGIAVKGNEGIYYLGRGNFANKTRPKVYRYEP